MINVYQKTNLDFTKNGDGTLQPIRCDLSMEINGAWSLEIEVPYDEEGRWQYLVEGSIIIVDVDCIRELSNTKQRFRVYDYKKGVNSLTAIAFPVAMESTHDAPIENVVITNKTGAQAMTALQAFTNKYTLYSNIANTGSTALSNTNVNSAIASGKDDCFIQIWGGEICYDNLKFSVLNRLGENQAEKHPVIYGRNMTDVSYEKDDSGLITRLYPISQDGIRLSYDGKSYVDSPKILDYPIIHSRFIQAPYKLVIDDISNGSQTAVLTRTIQSTISQLVNTLSHSVYNSAVANKVEPEYIKKIRSDIVEAVQDMATANIYHADMNKIMRAAIKSSMDWLKDVSKPTWTWHDAGNDAWWYGASESSRAVSEYVYIDRIWRYFGDNAYWQRPKDDDSKKWDWIQESNGYRYGNNEKYYAQKTYVYITMDGQMKEYWFDEDGYWDGSDDTDSSYAWHGSGTSADPWWFGEEGATSEDTNKFLHDGWWFIDGTYYYFDEYGYYDGSTKFEHYQWDWVETSNSKWWFGNDANHNFARVYVTNQWLKVGGDWYRFDGNGYAIGGTALETEVINLFKTGMAQLKTTCETLNTQAYTLLYNLMKGYCDRCFAYQGIDVPTVTITVNMVDLSQTIEYKDYKNLEKVCLGDNVKCVDYEHGISTTERVVSITYDCIRRYNSEVTIGVAESTVADKLGVNAGGGEASGGFDTSVIESTLTSHTNELARLDSVKQDKLTAGENITIVNNVISATGGGHGDCTCHYGVGAPEETLGINGDIYVEMSPDPSGCEDSITYNRSSNLSSITNSYSDGFHKIEGLWWTDRYEHSYTTYRIDGLTAGETYDVILKVKVKNLVQEYASSSELFGIAIQNGGSFTTLSEHVKNGEFAYYEDGSDKIYFQSLKPMTTKVQSYSFKFTAFSNTYILISPDSIVNDSSIPMDIEIAISDGTIGNYIENVYYKVEDEWLLYDNDTKYVAGDNITITEVDGENVISATDTDAIEDLTDVELDNLSNGQILKYNSTTQKWENGNESGGTPVVANPSGTATADLNKIQVDNTIYKIPQGGGGSGGVIPNPEGTPTETLNTIGFNEIENDYYLQNGLVGASGGSYVYCNLDKNMESGLTYKVILRDGSSVYTSEFGWEGSTKTINISGFELTVQSTKAGLTYYSGAYRNIYCDIYTEYTETTIYQIEGGGTSSGSVMNIKHANWVASSSSSTGTALTDTLDLKKGKYLLIAHSPLTNESTAQLNVDFQFCLKVNGNILGDSYRVFNRQYGECSWVLELSEDSTVVLCSGMGASITWVSGYLYLGGIDAIELNQIQTPVIYSTEEREIGVWTDNKPLYQKTFIQQLSGNHTTIDILTYNMETATLVDGYYDTGVTRLSLNEHVAGAGDTYTHINIGANPPIIDCYNSIANNSTIYATVQYTKTTDTAGSGSYNTLGVPTVHYTTDEQVIGTWIDGKPLYRRTWNFSTGVTISSNSWQATDIAVADTHINVITDCKALNDDGQMMNYISATTDLATQTYVMLFNSRTNAGMVVKYLTLEYTKTTD